MTLYIILSIFLFLIGSLLGVYGLYYLAYISLAVPVVLIFLNKQGLKNLKVERKLSEDRIFNGEESQAELMITNDSIWPIFWLSYDETIPVRLHTPPTKQGVTFLAPGQQLKVDYNLRGYRRGFYQLGPARIKVGDGLGFVEDQITYLEEQYLVVYPRISPIDKLGLPSRIVFGDLVWPQKIYQDPTSFRGLRDYQRGDRLKDVYWPATASSGKLMVKEYESTITVENMIFLNLNQEDYGLKSLGSEVELAVEAAASITHYLAHCNQTVGLATNGEDQLKEVSKVEPGQGLDHLMRILEVLARLEVTESRSFISVIEENCHQIPPGSTMIFLTKRDTVELVKKALELARKGLNIVIITTGSIEHPQYLNRPYTENLVIYQLHRKEDIYGWGKE